METKDKPKGQSDLFTNEDKALAFFEKQRWPDGPVCPHCGEINNAYKLAGKTTRKGLYKCAGCRKTFTVKMRSIFEDSHIPLHKWYVAVLENAAHLDGKRLAASSALVKPLARGLAC